MIILLLTNLLSLGALIIALYKIKALKQDIRISDALYEQTIDDIVLLYEDIHSRGEEKRNGKTGQD